MPVRRVGEASDVAQTYLYLMQQGDLATSPNNTDCDAVAHDPVQNHFINKGTQQGLLALAIDLRPLPDFRQPGTERKKVILLFSTERLRFACLNLTTGKRILRLSQFAQRRFPPPFKLGSNQTVIRVDPIVLALRQERLIA
jgi:hypothetical protein